MTGKFTLQKWITREDLRNNPDTIYVFGDNLMQVGMGGQAAEMRGEPNALGIPTKVYPSMDPAAFFEDGNETHRQALFAGLAYVKKYLNDGVDVVFPEDGIGSGLSKLPEKAPVLNAFLIGAIEFFQKEYA